MKARKNCGEVLVVLVVAFLIVSTLASSVIHYSYVGLQISKSYNNYSSKSYIAEEALNIIRAGLQDECSDLLKTQYDRMLDTYSFVPNSQRNLVFKEYYIKALNEAFIGSDDIENNLQDYVQTSDETSINEDITPEIDLKAKFLGYLANSDKNIIVSESLNSNKISILDNMYINICNEYNDESSETLYITIKNIRINYSDREGASSTVGADIVIETPMIFDESNGGYTYESDYLDYVLIADKSIDYNVLATTNISGSLYAGEDGINIGRTSNPTVNIQANYVNTRGDIFLSNGSALTITNKKVGQMCDVFAKNIDMRSVFNGSAPSYLNINANTYIEDDLEVNTENATVALRGTYTGYGTDELDYSIEGNIVNRTNNKSSSIIINKSNAQLNLSNLTNLVIAGKTYITPSKSGADTIQKSVITSESMSAKFMQIAYMVPSACISTHTNPVQYDDSVNVDIDLSLCQANGGMNLEDPNYTISSIPIIIRVPGQNGTSLEYYFLRFMSEEGQKKYIKDYMEFYTDYINYKAESALEGGSITFGDSTAYVGSGNILTYEYDNSGKLSLNLLSSSYAESYLEEVRNRANLKAISRNSTLAYGQTDTLTDSLFSTIINEDNIDTTHTYAYYTLDDYNIVDMNSETKARIALAKDSVPYDCIVYTNDTPYTVPGNMNRGLIIAYGDVNLSHDFMGCIISKGKININAGCNLYSDSEADGIYPLLSLLLTYADAETIQSFFRNFAGTESGIAQSYSLDVRNLVKVDNWVVY